MSLPRVLTVIFLPTAIAAQQARRPAHITAESSAATMVAAARSDALHRAVWLIDILRQREGSQPATKLDSVADGFAKDIIAASALSTNDRSVVSAISIIGNAGSPAGRIGVPYPAAMDLLIQIHRDGSGTARSLSLWRVLSVVGDRRRGLRYLRSVAESQTDPTAIDAMNALMEEAASGGVFQNPQPMRDEAAEVLKFMWDAKSVHNTSAFEALGRVASSRGWK